MDKEKEKVGRVDWGWLPVLMPGVAERIAAKKQEHGARWVAECWKRGVLLRQKGYFWAAEGALCVGTPSFAKEVNDWFLLYGRDDGASMLILPDPPVGWVR